MRMIEVEVHVPSTVVSSSKADISLFSTPKFTSHTAGYPLLSQQEEEATNCW